MKIEELSIDAIKPYEKNPRKNDGAVNGVAESIKQFGFQQPIVVDKNGVIVAGHTRYKAAVKLGLKTVPCVRADQLTPKQVKAYRILDNKLNELATWDFALLNEELPQIESNLVSFNVAFPIMKIETPSGTLIQEVQEGNLTSAQTDIDHSGIPAPTTVQNSDSAVITSEPQLVETIAIPSDIKQFEENDNDIEETLKTSFSLLFFNDFKIPISSEEKKYCWKNMTHTSKLTRRTKVL